MFAISTSEQISDGKIQLLIGESVDKFLNNKISFKNLLSQIEWFPKDNFNLIAWLWQQAPEK